MRIPNKKISVVMLITVLIVTSTIVISKVSKKNNEFIPQNNFDAEISIDLQDTLQNDRDGDGLLDWEEILWKTDPDNPDTDGDGTNDGQEVQENRNPLLAGENDTLKNIDEQILEKIENDEREFSGLTKNFSDDLVKNYFSLRAETGSNLSKQQKNDLVKDLISEIMDRGKIKNRYSESSLVVFDDSVDKSGLLNYANDLLLIEKKAKELFKQNSEGSNDFYFTIGEEMANELISVKTPARMASTQTILANNYYNFGVSLLWMENDNDPLLQIIGLSLFNTSAESLVDNWSIIIQYLKNNDIILDGNVFILNTTY
jgi:hypothetical protein